MNEELSLENIEISLSEGIKWADKYRKDTGIEEGKRKKVDGFLIPVETLRMVLNQDIQAVRAYNGINNEGEQTLIFVGAKWDPEKKIYVDVFRSDGLEMGGDVVYDGARPVPPYGDPESPLNP